MNKTLMMLMVSGNPAVRPDDAAGIRPARLLGCSEGPNCVSTEAQDRMHKIDVFHLKGDFSKNWHEIQDIVAKIPRSIIVRADETYIHAIFKSRIFRFVDNLELLLDPLSGIISIRSGAQSGYWDLGVNRGRAEQLRHELQAKDLIRQPVIPIRH